MMLRQKDLADFEGLIHKTAARYAGILEDDYEDICQALRIKIWKVIPRYTPSRSNQTLEDYVFSCMVNYVKDLLKAQARRDARTHGRLASVDSLREEHGASFERRYLMESEESAYLDVEDAEITLPSTLSELECKVVHLLLLDFNQREIAGVLGFSRTTIRRTQATIEVKMADWRPTSTTDSRQPVAA